MVAADTAENGNFTFLLTFTGPDGSIELLDSSLNLRWARPLSADHAEFVEIGGKKYIVASSSGDMIVILDTAGNIVRQRKCERYIGKFSLVEWPESADTPSIL